MLKDEIEGKGWGFENLMYDVSRKYNFQMKTTLI
jgi:hypothetical protein